MLKTLLWRGLTIIAICLAMLGVILPGLPATEFILLAAWSSAKGWPAVNFWLLNHKTFGPMIKQWRTHKVIPRKAKIICGISIGGSAYLIIISTMELWVKSTFALIMLLVLLWLLSRPEQVHTTSS